MATTGLSALGSQSLGQSDLLKLLVTQLQNQDPLEPVKDTDFIGQMAQFSVLQGIETLNANFGDQLTMQQLTGGSSLLGKTVKYGSNSSGVVSALNVSSGNVYLQVGNDNVPLAYVTGVLPT